MFSNRTETLQHTNRPSSSSSVNHQGLHRDTAATNTTTNMSFSSRKENKREQFELQLKSLQNDLSTLTKRFQIPNVVAITQQNPVNGNGDEYQHNRKSSAKNTRIKGTGSKVINSCVLLLIISVIQFVKEKSNVTRFTDDADSEYSLLTMKGVNTRLEHDIR